MFPNAGLCPHGKSYFERYRDKNTEEMPKIGLLKSHWWLHNGEGKQIKFVSGTPRGICFVEFDSMQVWQVKKRGIRRAE